MDDPTPPETLRTRLSRSGEDALGRLAQDLLENPLVSGAIARAFEARERASQAQEVAMGALNLPSAADLERLTRRVRSVSQRLEGIEDGVDRLDERLAGLSGAAGLDRRLDAIEEQLARIAERLDREPEPARRAATARTTTRKARAGKPAAEKPPAEKPPAAEPGHGAQGGVA